jgi:hypothetical protein
LFEDPTSVERIVLMRILKRSQFGLILVVAIVAVFTVVPAALAQDPLSDPSSAQYDAPIPQGGVAGSTAGGGAGGAGGGASEPAGTGAVANNPGGGGLNSNLGSLPFTGVDLIIVFGVALALTGTGIALRRLSSSPGSRV